MTLPDPSKDWYQIDDPEAAKYLIEPRSRGYLIPFIGRERTASAVSEELGEAITTVLYRVKRMLTLGLLRVSHLEARRGRSIRHYRTVSDTLFAPFRASSAASVEELFIQALKHHEDTVLGSVAHAWTTLAPDWVTWGVYAKGDDEGLSTLAVVPDKHEGQPYDLFGWLVGPESPSVWDNTYMLHLSDHDAKEMQRDLQALQKRYALRQIPNGRSYVVRTTLAPTKSG